MKINNSERYCRKFKECFEIVKRKLITNSHHNSNDINKSVDNRGAGGFSLFGNASGNYKEINIEK